MADREVLSQEEIDALLNTVEVEEKSTDEGMTRDPQKTQAKAKNDLTKINPNMVMPLKEELMDVEMAVSSIMAQTNSTLGKLMSWQVGDFISLEMNEVITLDIAGTPGFTATIGSTNDKRAVKIIKKISY